MGWLDIRNRIETPILGDDAATIIVNTFLKNENVGSRTLKLSDYIEPTGPVYSDTKVTDSYRKSLDYELTRYIAKSLLKECDVSDKDKKVSFFIKDFGETLSTNPSLVNLIDPIKKLTVGELIKISTMSDIGMDVQKKNNTTPIGAFLSYSLSYACLDLSCSENEACGKRPIYPCKRVNKDELDLSGFDLSYSKRIYLNRDWQNIETWTFIIEYIKKCIDARIPFHMKPCGPYIAGIDSLNLYSDDRCFDKRISIIEEIIKEHPEVMRNFGTPIATGGMVRNSDGRCYYTVSHASWSNNKRSACTYNSYWNMIINSTYVVSAIEFLKNDLHIKLSDFLKNEEISENEEIKKAITILWYDMKLDSRNSEAYKALGKIIEYGGNFPTMKRAVSKYVDLNTSEGKMHSKKIAERFKENVRKVNSVYIFGDDRHIDTPIYMNEGFIQFNKKAESSIMFKYYKVYSAIIRARFPQAISMPEYKELSSDVKFLIKKVIDVSDVSSLTNMEIDIMDKSFLKLEKIATDITAKSGKEVYSYKVVRDNCFNGLISEDDFRTLRINIGLIYSYFPKVINEYRNLSPEVRVIIQKIRKTDNPYELSLREMHIVSSDSVKEQLDNMVNIVNKKHNGEINDMFDDRDDDISVVSKKNI